MVPQFLFMEDYEQCHRKRTVKDLLESEDIERYYWPQWSTDLDLIEHGLGLLGRFLVEQNLLSVTIQELRLTLQNE